MIADERLVTRHAAIDLLVKMNPATRHLQLFNLANAWNPLYIHWPTIRAKVDQHGTLYFGDGVSSVPWLKYLGRIKGTNSPFHMLFATKTERVFLDSWTFCAIPDLTCTPVGAIPSTTLSRYGISSPV